MSDYSFKLKIYFFLVYPVILINNESEYITYDFIIEYITWQKIKKLLNLYVSKISWFIIWVLKNKLKKNFK